MGAWGAGLYSDDLALDLRPAISAVCRLPKDGNEIVKLLRELNHEVLDDADEEPVFWLVVADQLQHRGIESEARVRALQIIDDGTDVVRLERLGLDPTDLRKRQRALEQLREKLAEPPVAKQRRYLKKPQAQVVASGEVYAFPVDDRGNPVNPYMTQAQRDEFEPAGWSTCLVTRTGHALDYFAWCQLIASSSILSDRPSLPSAVAALDLGRSGVGTLSRAHFKKMRLELLGVTEDRPDLPPPESRRTMSVTASDISAANVLSQWRPPPGFTRS